MEGICVKFLEQVQFLRFLKGHHHGNQLFVIVDLCARSWSISGSAGPIFTIFAPYGRYWIADDQPAFFFRYLKGRYHGNQFCGNFVAKLWQNYLPPCTYRSVIPKRNGISPCILCALIAPLIAQTSCKKWWKSVHSFWVKVGQKMKIVLRLGRNWTIFVHLAYWHSDMDWNITVLISSGYRQSFLYMLWKFGEIRISHPGVLGEKNCTAGVDNCYHA